MTEQIMIYHCVIYQIVTTRKVSNYGVSCGPYSPVFGLNTRKYDPDITQYLDTFHAVCELSFFDLKPLWYPDFLSAKIANDFLSL